MATGTPILIKGPKIDWIMNSTLNVRYVQWKRMCQEIFQGPMEKLSEKVHYLHYWCGIQGQELIHSWKLQYNKLDDQWAEFARYCKPTSNEILAVCELKASQ